MSNTITVRLTPELAEWLTKTARRRGTRRSAVVREQLEKARKGDDERPWMKLAGSISGPPDLSSRKGFSKS